jgi:hypothetical protein
MPSEQRPPEPERLIEDVRQTKEAYLAAVTRAYREGITVQVLKRADAILDESH